MRGFVASLMIFPFFLMADSYVMCCSLLSSRVAGTVKEAFLAGYWELYYLLRFRVAAIPKESLELDYALF